MRSTTMWEAVLTEPVAPDRDHLRGRFPTRVVLLEYGDYECPFCAAAVRVVHGLQQRLGDAMCVAFRHFPITTAHPHAGLAAEAAEAAGSQGRFWQMHEVLFANQQRLDAHALLTYAESLGLNLERFSTELRNRVHADVVRRNFLSGVRSGVNGTPTFYINGVRHDGSWEITALLQAIADASQAAAVGQHPRAHA